MKYCPYCGTRLAESTRFCPGCGKRLDNPGDDQPSASAAQKQTEATGLEARVTEMKRDIRSWGFGLIVIGVIHLGLSEFLDPLWGGILIATGITCLFVRQRGMYVAIGIILMLAGIMNILLGGLGGWAIFGVFQIGFGIYQIHNFRKYGRTTTSYDKAIGWNPDNIDAHCDRGDAHAETGEYDKAIADYSRAIELDPRYASAYFNRAYAYGEMGEYDRAIADYSKAIELDPSDAQAYYNRGLDYQNKGEVSKAVSDLEKCIELSTDPELTKDAQQALLKTKNSLK